MISKVSSNPVILWILWMFSSFLPFNFNAILIMSSETLMKLFCTVILLWKSTTLPPIFNAWCVCRQQSCILWALFLLCYSYHILSVSSGKTGSPCLHHPLTSSTYTLDLPFSMSVDGTAHVLAVGERSLVPCAFGFISPFLSSHGITWPSHHLSVWLA